MIVIGKNINIGTCALCKEQNVQLRASHLIPKLAYIRTKSDKKSRFRAMNDIKRPLQDGEKKYLLCSKCEEFFSVYETQFTNFFLDDFIKNKTIEKNITRESWFVNYMLSVVWRIIYDDLYNAGSFSGEGCRILFEGCEKDIGSYFNSLMNNTVYRFPQYKHYVYKIEEIVKNENVIKLLEPTLFGYCYFDGEYKIPMVITYYLGIVFVTVLDDGDYIFIDSIKKMFERKYCLSKIIRNIVSKEIEAEAVYMANRYQKEMTPQLYEKIKKYYNKK